VEFESDRAAGLDVLSVHVGTLLRLTNVRSTPGFVDVFVKSNHRPFL